MLNTALKPRSLQTHVKVLYAWRREKTGRPQEFCFRASGAAEPFIYTVHIMLWLLKTLGLHYNPLCLLFSSERVRPITVSNISHQLYEVCWLWWACIGSWTQELFWEHGLLHPHIAQSRLWKFSAMQFTIKCTRVRRLKLIHTHIQEFNNRKNVEKLPVCQWFSTGTVDVVNTPSASEEHHWRPFKLICKQHI